MNAGREIDTDSHQKFLDLFQQRHFKGSDFREVSTRLTGFARDYYSNERNFLPVFTNIVNTIMSITRVAGKLRKEGQIGTYAEMLLVGRSIELAFFGKHHLLF